MLHTHRCNGRKSDLQWWLFIACLLFCSGCMLPAGYEDYVIGDFGHIEVRPSKPQVNGFVVGVLHGATEPDALDYARTISDATGSGIVVAYGMKNKRIAVSEPVILNRAMSRSNAAQTRPQSIYSDFKTLLQSSAVGPLKFYIEFRTARAAAQTLSIEVVSAGFSFEQLLELKRSFKKIESESIRSHQLLPVELIIDPLDTTFWAAFGVKNHGVLMLAERGLSLRLPNVLAEPRYKSVYREVLKNWLRYASEMSQSENFASTAIRVKQVRYGRIELTPARGKLRGVVIAAPHGSFDWYTAELVEQLSYRTSLPSVVTRGFTPTECEGWRIDVNRPTERRYPTDNIERTTERAIKVYRQFSEIVMAASLGPLNLYIDMHQNGTEDAIMVATVGITSEQAGIIKASYHKIRDRMINAASRVRRVNLLIEPLDQVSIGAWAAKDHGILRRAKKSLHFELPAQHVLYRDSARQVYTKILAELIGSIITAQPSPTRDATITADRS